MCLCNIGPTDLADDARVEEGGDGCEGLRACALGGLREVFSGAVRRELQSPIHETCLLIISLGSRRGGTHIHTYILYILYNTNSTRSGCLR